MNKVVYNMCYGGFGLSRKATQALADAGVEEAIEYMPYMKNDPVCVTSLKNPGLWHIANVSEVLPGYVRLTGMDNRFHSDSGLEARRGRAEHRIDPATKEQLQTYRNRQEISRLQNKIDHITRAWRVVKPDGDQVERLRKILALVEALDASLTPIVLDNG